MSQTQRASTAPNSGLDRFFKITQRGSTVSREIRGGVVTFLTMAYIIVLNPIILSGGVDINDERLGGADGFGAIAAATALAAGVLTILMGAVANYPLAIATGLGLNAFVTFSIASQMTWADAMGLVVIEGLIILVLVLTGFREAVFKAVPAQLKIAISVGIGLFLTIIGLVDAGFVRRMPDIAATTVPVQLGVGGQLQGWPVALFCLGLVIVFALFALRVKGAILITIVSMTVLAIIVEKVASVGGAFTEAGYNPLGWALNVPAVPDDVIGTPDLELLGNFSLLGSWENAGIVVTALLIFTLLLADFFDTLGTMTAVGSEAGLLDEEGMPPNTNRILIVDSLAAAAGGAASVSSNTSYIESASGVAEGARTGLASVVTGLLFLLAMFFAPVVNIIPSEAAVPALVLVGFLMMQQVRGIDWEDLEIAIPAFLTIVLMPFTYSITVGIGAGFIAYVILKVVRGKAALVHPLMWVVAGLFVVYFAIHPITAWLT